MEKFNLNESGNLALDLFVQLPIKQDKKGNEVRAKPRFIKETELKIENIEAELVFKIRSETGEWTTHQNEIHFNNFFDEGKSTAEEIYLEIK